MFRLILTLLFLTLISYSQTFEQVSDIIYNKCTSCHRPGESGPMSFTNYNEVASLGNMIEYVTQSGYMPPWPPDQEYSTLLDEHFLTDSEKQIISDWVSNGMPQGDPIQEAEIPFFSEGSAIGEPDYVFELEEEYFIEGNNLDDYRVFVFPTNFTEDTYIKAIEFRPDNREAVHHALIMADVTGTGASQDAESPDVLGYEAFGGFNLEGVSPNDYVFLGGYAPGMNPIVWSGNLGMKIPAGADILCQIHYAPSSIDEWDKSSINLFTKPASEVEREVQMKMWLRLDLDIPANTETTIEACLNFSNSNPFLDFFGPGPYQFFDNVIVGEQNCELPEAWSLLGILPHSHLMGKSWEVYAETPSGENIPIIKIPDWDFDWQGFYYPEYMQYIPVGSRIEAIAKYDNTNDFDMSWGELTTDEMFFCPIYYVPYEEGDENIYLGPGQSSFVTESVVQNLELYPSPALDYLELSFTINNFTDNNTLVKIFDISGKEVYKNELNQLTNNNNSYIIDIKRLKKGQYLLEMISNNDKVVKKFTKQ